MIGPRKRRPQRSKNGGGEGGRLWSSGFSWQRHGSGRGMSWKLALLALTMFVLLLPGRASIPPFDRDEPRYMQATSQMLETHDFIDVRFQDKPRYLQPAGMYWLEAAAVSASGTLKQHEVWAYRVPTLLAMTAAVVLTAWIGASLFTLPIGLMAAALLGASVLVTAEGRMATIDSTLLLSVMLAQAAIMRVLLDREAERETKLVTALLYWGALGLGLMLKGPVILIPGFGTPVAMALIERNWSWFRRFRPAWGWLLTLAIVLPWCIAIGVVSHGAFFSNAVGTNFLGKIGSGQQAHGLPPGFHLVVFAVAFWPGSFFAALAFPAIWASRRSFQTRYLLCWIVPHWLVFEAIATKLPHYVLPTYPAIALLTAFGLSRAPERWNFWPTRWWTRGLLGFYGVLWAVVGLALVAAGPILLWSLEHKLSVSAGIAAFGGLLPLVMAVVLVVNGRPWRAAMAAIAGAVIVYTGLFLAVVPKLDTIWLAPRLTDLVDEYRPCQNTEVVSASFSEPSLVFLMGGKVELRGAKEAGEILARNPSCALVLVDRRSEAAFMAGAGALHPVEFGRAQGLNYSTGKKLDIGLFGVSAP